MAERVFMLPDPGEGLEEAEIVAWLVAEGDAVELNQPFVEIETAKATVEIPSPHAGRIAKLHASEGEIVRVGNPLVTFDVPGAEDGPAAATPAVRKLARDLGVDLASTRGSGPGGRITPEDVLAAGAAASEDAERLPVAPIRRAIAARLTQAAAIPQVTTFRTVDCSALEALRRELGVSPLPLFVRALVEVVPDHPLLNSSWATDEIVVHRKLDVGIAVDTERGLVVPVVRDAGSLGISRIAAEIGRLAEAAREGKLTPAEASGSTIAVSNTGSYGSEAGTPLLNPGNAVTVALGAIGPRALVVDGQVLARPACTISLTFDHRVLDGADAGRALTDLVALLQDPDRLRDLPG
ncbi:MAG: 2-oxo acid dehydrogenase subunit E2 [Actinobacteria bacterium]|nr:2-oxo acid dehydrogenase subunit E2 [Actinomycetota bacterium]